ncbi:MAG: BrnT family toxin [Proteobacteria bacterium]|nr:BrnT family toxin [Pseudomonadota bacterium]
MQDDAFEWDDAKAAANWRRHGVSFEMAREAFRDAFAVEWADLGQDTAEQRFAMLAVCEGRVLFVAYALRGERIRIISARKAVPHEQRRYHEENRGG